MKTVIAIVLVCLAVAAVASKVGATGAVQIKNHTDKIEKILNEV